MHELVPLAGTLLRHVGPPSAVIPPAFALTQPLPLLFLSGLAPGIVLDKCPRKSTLPDVDGVALIAAPHWGPWLAGLCYGSSLVGVSSSVPPSFTASSPFVRRPLHFLSLSWSLSLSGPGPQAILIS